MESKSNIKILVVEDTPPVLRALQRQLELEGYSFLSATNGQEALDILAKEENISLIISDWMMPIMDGFELLETIKKDDRYKDLPFLMLTGKDSPEGETKAILAGAIDYARKPYKPEEFMAQIDKILQNNNPSD